MKNNIMPCIINNLWFLFSKKKNTYILSIEICFMITTKVKGGASMPIIGGVVTVFNFVGLIPSNDIGMAVGKVTILLRRSEMLQHPLLKGDSPRFFSFSQLLCYHETSRVYSSHFVSVDLFFHGVQFPSLNVLKAANVEDFTDILPWGQESLACSAAAKIFPVVACITRSIYIYHDGQNC